MSWIEQTAEEEQSAPGGLEAVRGFVNTLDIEEGTDRLESVESAADWLAEADLAPLGETPSEDDRRHLIAIREALREMLLANNHGERAPEGALEELNRHCGQAAIGLRFDADGSELVARGEGVEAAVAALLARIHEALEEGSWRRLKVCPAEDCHWAFYDHSRNRSGTWCEMGICGNRAKARAYRERHRPQSSR